MKKILILLVFFSLIDKNTTFAQNKGAENFEAIKKYFTIVSSNGPYLELDPKQSARKGNDWLPNKRCYGVFVQADNYTSAVSEIMVFTKKDGLEFRDEIVYFKQKPSKKYAEGGFIIIYVKKKGDIPKLESFEF